MNDWTISAPAWGACNVEQLAKTLLPSLRAALRYAGISTARLVVHTDHPQEMQAIGHGFEVECRPVMPGEHKYRQLGNCHRDALDRAPRGSKVMLACADMLVSRETFTACEQHFAGSTRAIAACAQPTLAPNAPAGLPAPELLDWSVAHTHPYAHENYWGGRAVPPSTTKFRNGSNVTLRGFHLHPIAVINDRPMPFAITIDEDLLGNFAASEIHVVTDPNEMSFAECSPANRTFVRASRPNDVEQIVAWARHLPPVNWWLSTHRIIIKGNGDTPDEAIWAEIMRHAPPLTWTLSA